MSNDKILQLLDAIGAVAECVHAMYDQLRKQGFSPEYALKLTQTWMATTFQPHQPREDDE